MVEYINYKKKKLPIRISFYVEKKLKEDKIDLKKFAGDENPALDAYTQLESVLFYALEAGHHAEDKPMELTREDMAFVLDECVVEFTNVLRGTGEERMQLNEELGEKKPKPNGALKQQVKEMGKMQRKKKTSTSPNSSG